MKKLIALVAALAATSSVYAAPISGSGPFGSFTGSLNYNSGSQTISVTLNNTSPVGNGGFLTGFAFNLPFTASGVTYSTSDADFQLLGTAPGFGPSITVAPHGQADIGAAVGGNWEGGGAPSDGIGVGGSGTWTFVLGGIAPGGLTAELILATLTNTGGPGGNQADNFIVRFRGFNNGESDKVSDGEGGGSGDPDPNAVPEPATMLTLGLLGAMGFVGYRLRKKKA